MRHDIITLTIMGAGWALILAILFCAMETYRAKAGTVLPASITIPMVLGVATIWFVIVIITWA